MKVVIIKYNAGNIRSVQIALERIGAQCIVSDLPEEIHSADKVIFPGVGEASSAMHYLRQNQLDKVIRSLKQPVLGICLGMQLMCRFSEEGNTECLDIIPVDVKKFVDPTGSNKIPHIGWNTVFELQGPLMQGVKENEFVYFVHSYYAEFNPFAIATSDYCLKYASAMQKDNFYAVQFHPEKSGIAGEKILSNFLKI